MARERQMALTRERALAAARKLWAEPGTYDVVTVRDIAAEMGRLQAGSTLASGTRKPSGAPHLTTLLLPLTQPLPGQLKLWLKHFVGSWN